ncbi:MAG: S-layer homology domain-containing protein, partial [Oscillospiraceae bacterium]|nr:S-layer homology domain-containing protein [Oscillospiraceae bacterium]
KGQLVTISSSRSGYLTLTRVSSSGATGALNVAQRTLDGALLSSRAALYERTLNGTPRRISWGQITVASVPASKISYVGTDLSGAIDIIILDDVTGDGYTYGYMKSEEGETVQVPSLDDPSKIEFSYSTYNVVVENSSGKHELRTLSSNLIRSTPGGMAASTDGRVGATVTLTAVNNVPRSAFDVENMTVTVNGVTYPIAQGVECYNKAAGSWFGSGADGLNAARAYAATLTIYYDKGPAQGGKIRLVVVE